jgi:hypothetical protein
MISKSWRGELIEPVRIELGEQRPEIRHVESTTVLAGIAAIFYESDLDLVTGEHGRVVGRVAARQNTEAEHSLVERHSRSNVLHGQLHVVALVAKRFLERSLHDASLHLSSSISGCVY